MVRKQILFFVSLVAAGLILIMNFYRSGQQALVIASLVPVGLMVYTRWAIKPIMGHISLAGFTVLTAIGVILNNVLLPMALALATALASWDFVLEMCQETRTTGSYEKTHLKYLGLALGLGLLGIGVGQMFHWKLPFIVLILSGVTIVASVDRLLRYFLHNKETNQ